MSKLIHSSFSHAVKMQDARKAIESLKLMSKDKRGETLCEDGVVWFLAVNGEAVATIGFITEQPEKVQRKIFATMGAEVGLEKAGQKNEIDEIMFGWKAFRPGWRISSKIVRKTLA